MLRGSHSGTMRLTAPLHQPGGGNTAAAAQRVLNCPQQRVLAAGPDHQQPRRIETVGGEPRGVGAGAAPAPHHAAADGGKAGEQQRGEAAVVADQLVQATPRQATPRKGGVGGLGAERHWRTGFGRQGGAIFIICSTIDGG